MLLPHNTTRLDALLSPLIESAGKIGAKIHVGKVDVNYNVPHREALLAGAPDTPAHAKSLTLSVEEFPENSGQESRVLVLLHFPDSNDRLNYIKACDWARENHLMETVSHDIYALGAEYPDLPQEVSSMYMTVVETTGYIAPDTNRLLCTVVWENKARKAGLTLAQYFYSGVNYFAFILPF